MVKIKMVGKDGSREEMDACLILAHINENEEITVLRSMDWASDGKRGFLKGQKKALLVTVAEPLSDEDADQAIREYHELGYI